MEAGTAPTGQELEDELAELLDQETFDPPAEFVEQALLSDPAIYEEAAEDPVGWWEKQAEDLHWFEKWDTALDAIPLPPEPAGATAPVAEEKDEEPAGEEE